MEQRCAGQKLLVDGTEYTVNSGNTVFVKAAGSSKRKPLYWKKQWSWPEFRDQISIAHHGAPHEEASAGQAGELNRVQLDHIDHAKPRLKHTCPHAHALAIRTDSQPRCSQVLRRATWT